MNTFNLLYFLFRFWLLSVLLSFFWFSFTVTFYWWGIFLGLLFGSFWILFLPIYFILIDSFLLWINTLILSIFFFIIWHFVGLFLFLASIDLLLFTILYLQRRHFICLFEDRRRITRFSLLWRIFFFFRSIFTRCWFLWSSLFANFLRTASSWIGSLLALFIFNSKFWAISHFVNNWWTFCFALLQLFAFLSIIFNFNNEL